MSNFVEIKIERAPYLDDLRIRRMCAPHFAEGNDVRFVDADGHPILDVTKEGGWVKEYDAPQPPAEPASEAVEAPSIEASSVEPVHAEDVGNTAAPEGLVESATDAAGEEPVR